MEEVGVSSFRSLGTATPCVYPQPLHALPDRIGPDVSEGVSSPEVSQVFPGVAVGSSASFENTPFISPIPPPFRKFSSRSEKHPQDVSCTLD